MTQTSNKSTPPTYDIAIIGAGAAGLATAISAGRHAQSQNRSLRIVAIDGARTLGAKILVAGGGRCNVTHKSATARDYFGDSAFIDRVLKRFSTTDAQNWFVSMGVPLHEEATGKLFPQSNSGRTVLNALTHEAGRHKIELLHPVRVHSITTNADGVFILSVNNLSGAGESIIKAHRVVVATGGMALPKSGSDGAGYNLATAFKHNIVPVVPALVPLLCADPFLSLCQRLSGVSTEVVASAWVDGRKVASRQGNLLFTHFGLSGPVAMDLSRVYCRSHQQEGSNFRLTINLAPQHDFSSMRAVLLSVKPGTTVQTLCRKNFELPRKLALEIQARAHNAVQALGPGPKAHCATLQNENQVMVNGLNKKVRAALIRDLVEMEVPIAGQRGWHKAESTAGGVPLSEVSNKMESKLQPGLFFVGEILDCDGRIGGFSFQWAWATGYIVGRALSTSF